MKDLARPVSADELLLLPRDGMRSELVRGEVRKMPPPGAEHGSTTSNIHYFLEDFVRPKYLGRIFAAETGFLIERDPDTVRAPDCAFVSRDRMPHPIPRKYLPFAPDLAVETLSPDDRPPAVKEKVEQWLQCGSRAVWVIDPVRREVTVYRTGRAPRVLGEGDTLDGEEILPGFSILVARIFQ